MLLIIKQNYNCTPDLHLNAIEQGYCLPAAAAFSKWCKISRANRCSKLDPVPATDVRKEAIPDGIVVSMN